MWLSQGYWTASHFCCFYGCDVTSRCERYFSCLHSCYYSSSHKTCFDRALSCTWQESQVSESELQGGSGRAEASLFEAGWSCCELSRRCGRSCTGSESWRSWLHLCKDPTLWNHFGSCLIFYLFFPLSWFVLTFQGYSRSWKYCCLFQPGLVWVKSSFNWSLGRGCCCQIHCLDDSPSKRFE